jgi:hypothetical protein
MMSRENKFAKAEGKPTKPRAESTKIETCRYADDKPGVDEYLDAQIKKNAETYGALATPPPTNPK